MAVKVGVVGGDKFLAMVAEVAKKLNKKGTMKAGFLETQTYPDGTYVAQVAWWLNYGTKSIAPFPFFSNMIADKAPGWGAVLANIAAASNLDTQLTLERFGEHVTADLSDSILDGSYHDLSPITLMLRKMKDDDPTLVVSGATVGEAARRVALGESGASGTRAKRLVDTGQLAASPAYEVNMQ
jgi:hypothetical protein